MGKNSWPTYPGLRLRVVPVLIRKGNETSAALPDNESTFFTSDGTNFGEEGDIIAVTNLGGNDKQGVLWDESAGQQTYPTRSADPSTSELSDGRAMHYVSDGSTGVTGGDGDVILAVNNGGTIKTKIVADFSAL